MGKKRRRRRSRRQSWWQNTTGGMKNWLAVTLVGALAVVAGGAAIFALQRDDAAASAAGEYASSPAPTFSFGTPDAEPEPIEFPRNASGGITAVYLGDSLTYGLFASSEAAGYRPQVTAALNAIAPVTESRAGQTGNKAREVGESAQIPADAGVIILALGTNDVYRTPQEEFDVDYQALVDKAKASAPNAVLVCVGSWTNTDGARLWDDGIQKPCEAAGGTYVPIWQLFDEPGNRGPAGVEAFGGTSDDFHPNDTGYAAIAQRVKDALRLP